jgi:hypothetical protein
MMIIPPDRRPIALVSSSRPIINLEGQRMFLCLCTVSGSGTIPTPSGSFRRLEKNTRESNENEKCINDSNSIG